jgi:hypothetical protein
MASEQSLNGHNVVLNSGRATVEMGVSANVVSRLTGQRKFQVSGGRKNAL